MKRTIFFLALLLTGYLISSCEKNDIDFEDEYKKSYRAWLDFKKSSGNTYNYTVTGASWVGIAWETKITVSKGVISQREFKYTFTQGLPENMQKEDLEWIEYQNEINSHGSTAAADPLTLDEIYTKAQKEWLVKRKDVQTYFETNNGGLISSCGYVPNGCMDDCFRGIHITNIQKGQ